MSEDENSETSETYQQPIKLAITNLMGTTFNVRMYSSNTILELKHKIQRLEGIPVAHQNLLFNKRELHDYTKISDAGLVNESTLQLILTMRGGPISTRRLSESQVLWKDLSELSLNKDTAYGSAKVSLLVFKEGEIINLIRVIENEDGSYSPYSRDKSSYESMTSKSESHLSVIKRISEDMDMAIKIQMLKLKLKNLSIKKEIRHRRKQENREEDLKKLEEYEIYEREIANLLDYLEIKKHLKCKSSSQRKARKYVEDSEAEDFDEMALKDKHRTKCNFTDRFLKETDTKASEDHNRIDDDQSLADDNISGQLLKPSSSRTFHHSYEQPTRQAEAFSIIKDHAEGEKLPIEVPCSSSESLSLSARAAELGRLHRSDDSDSIAGELEEPHDIWHINQGSGEATMKNPGKAYNFGGLIGKHIGLEHNYNVKSSPRDADELLNDDFFENDFYNLSHIVSSPTSVPYVSKESSDCDTFFEVGKSKSYNRLPLYGRHAKMNSGNTSSSGGGREREPDDLRTLFNLNDADDHGEYLKDIKTLENKYDSAAGDSKSSRRKSKSPDTVASARSTVDVPVESAKTEEGNHLGAISKKSMRCGHCKKRLTIVNIYNCRCGKIFCGQHRYSETHNCKYDYKTEGKKLIAQTNPLVIAKKLDKI